MFKQSWMVAKAPTLKDFEELLNSLQEKGYIIEDINSQSYVIVYSKFNEVHEPELLTEQQNEGRIDPNIKDYQAGFEWDRGDYGQQGL